MVAETVGQVSESVGRAIALIDEGLSTLQHREIVSVGEFADMLLDLRSLLVSAATSPVDDGEIHVVTN